MDWFLQFSPVSQWFLKRYEDGTFDLRLDCTRIKEKRKFDKISQTHWFRIYRLFKEKLLKSSFSFTEYESVYLTDKNTEKRLTKIEKVVSLLAHCMRLLLFFKFLNIQIWKHLQTFYFKQISIHYYEQMWKKNYQNCDLFFIGP